MEALLAELEIGETIKDSFQSGCVKTGIGIERGN
jgi:hypothetical protein